LVKAGKVPNPHIHHPQTLIALFALLHILQNVRLHKGKKNSNFSGFQRAEIIGEW
jgi:hypothetical protein